MPGNRKLSTITRADVERFRNAVEQGKKARDVRTKPHGRAVVRGGSGAASRTLGLLGALFAFAVSREYITKSPARGVKRKPDRRHERFLLEAELARLGDALREAEGTSPKGCNIVRLLALTDARRGEIDALC
jgi:integrase